MTQIKQDDILSGNISVTRGFTNLFNIAVTTGITYPANIITASQGTVYSENKSISGTYPLWIKTTSEGSVGWIREAEWQIHNQTITNNTTFFFNVGANTTVTPTSQNVTISVGTPIGIYGPGSWSLGANQNFSRARAGSGFGSQKSTIVTGGITILAGNIMTTATDFFNGSSWILSGSSNAQVRDMGTSGSQNSGLISAGIDTTGQLSNIQSFNGSTWTNGTANLSYSLQVPLQTGSFLAALLTAGSGAADISSTSLFNGVSWTLGPNLNMSRGNAVGGGTQNASLAGSGTATTIAASRTEIFNGSGWSLSGSLNTIRNSSGGAGTTNASYFCAGLDAAGSYITISELFNGSSWSYSNNTTVSRIFPQSTGSQNAGLLSGGFASTSIPIFSTELHSQTLYRPLNYQSYKTAKNIGLVAYNPGGATASTVSVAYSGYLNENVTLTSNNITITSNPQYSNSFIVLSRNSSTTLVTSLTDGFINKSITAITNMDIILGMNLSQTEIVMLGNTLSNFSPWIRW